MNTYIKYTLASFSLFFIGILFFAYQESWIIINIPQPTLWKKIEKSPTTNLDVKLFVFKNNQWITETKQIIKTNKTQETVQNLINSWLLLSEEENLLEKDIRVESVVLSPTKKIAFISLNKSPFNLEESTQSCLMIIEGMFRTIRENNIQLQAIQFLIKHKPLLDHRLNLELAWPITGYVNQ